MLTLAPATDASMRETLSIATLLDGAVDTCVVKFEPTAARQTPAKFYGIALNFDGVLWLYVPGLGTRCLGRMPAGESWSASLHRRLDADGLELRIYPNQVPIDPGELSQTLNNGCFAGCVYKLSRLLAEREPVTAAGVLFFSPREIPGNAAAVLDNIGHALLVFQSGSQWRIYDPAGHGEVLDFPGADLAVGRAVDARLLDYASTHGHPTELVRFFAFSDHALRELAFRARKLRQ